MSGVVFRILGGLVLLGLAACSAKFETSYDHPVAAETSSTWRLSEVSVIVPESLVISEAKTILPRADIVWREDPPGDRRVQIAKIITDATKAGAAGLHGNRPVRFEIVVQRFHALTFEAEARLSQSGVHNVDFTIRAVDAKSGEVLAGPTEILAATPALAGVEMVEARSRGETQKLHISRHLQAVIAGWLGLGPDPRGSFTRIGA
ncbi:MAG: hypothetical protein KDE08_04450 [Rhodobacteraceae bacterium]|nr:hypothetical protein [Paracoccaceae bacterium]